MSDLNKAKTDVYEKEIVPAILLYPENADLYNNYLIAPIAGDLTHGKPEIIEVNKPLDTRFINFYNAETKKYTLPYIIDDSIYSRYQFEYNQDLLLSGVYSVDNLKYWQTDDSFAIDQLYIHVVD
jgi:hypothetical protein